MRLTRLSVVLLCIHLAFGVTTGGCGSKEGSATASGAASFVGRASNAVVYIQWTRTGNTLSGSLQEAHLKERTGSGVESASGAFTGTVSAGGLTLTLNEALGSTKALAGRLTSGGFRLTFPALGHRLTVIRFAPGQVSDYNAAVRQLEGTSTSASETPSSNTESTTSSTETSSQPTTPPSSENSGTPANARWQLCPNVHGGALFKALALNTSCSEAQVVWHHFASEGEGPSPQLPTGWQCSLKITGNEQSRTLCSRGVAQLHFYED
jgi:hypothetical protein